jgi:hypothetical protein
MKVRSLETQVCARMSPLGLLNSPPEMTAWMLSYNRDIAFVVFIMSVRGGTNFLTRRGSRGVKAVN